MIRSLGTAALLALAQGAAAQGMDHGAMGDGPAAMRGYMTAMDAMMAAMPAESTGSADADFLRMMIPHHRSAIDMARVVLAQGEDPEVRALAEAIIAAQEAEIAEMQAMLDGMGS